MKRAHLLTTCVTLGVAMTGCDKSGNHELEPPDGVTATVTQRDAAVAERVKREIGEILGKSPASIRDTDQFIRDLGADSLDAVEIVMAIEEVFKISIADEDAEKLVSVGELIDNVSARTKPRP